LDLEDFVTDGPREAAFVEALGDALSEVGFFSLVNHGVDSEVVARAYAAAERFFTLPDAVKANYERRELNGQRGITSFGRERARDRAAADLKEFWHVGREIPAGAPGQESHLENLWPEEVNDFRESLTALYQQLEACALRLLEAAAVYLGEPRELIREMAAGGNTLLRVIHYPPVPADADPASMRAAPHEDINLITLLCEATAGGLEILTRDGVWAAIPSLPGQIIVDTGDMLQNLTNGLLRSATHRVVNPANSRERRFSMPFFVHPRAEVSLAPLPSCIARTDPDRLYPSITASEYLLQRLREIGLAG